VGPRLKRPRPGYVARRQRRRRQTCSRATCSVTFSNTGLTSRTIRRGEAPTRRRSRNSWLTTFPSRFRLRKDSSYRREGNVTSAVTRRDVLRVGVGGAGVWLAGLGVRDLMDGVALAGTPYRPRATAHPSTADDQAYLTIAE